MIKNNLTAEHEESDFERELESIIKNYPQIAKEKEAEQKIQEEQDLEK